MKESTVEIMTGLDRLPRQPFCILLNLYSYLLEGGKCSFSPASLILPLISPTMGELLHNR